MSKKTIALGDIVISSGLDGLKTVKGFVGIQDDCKPIVGDYFSNEQIEIKINSIKEHWSLNIDL